MSQQALISVIIPVYKVEKYLDQCVESVVTQTYKNLEIILVDDGSPDKCPEMCDSWARKDSRIKVVHKKNGGLGDARNAGLAIAKGDFIGFVDSDDWCESCMYEELLHACLKFDVLVSACNVWVDWENGWPTSCTEFEKENRCWNQLEIQENFCVGKLTAWAWNKLYKRDVVDFLSFPHQAYEDIPVARNLYPKLERLAFTGTALYHYRQRSSSIVNSSVRRSHFALIEENRKIVDMAIQKPYYGKSATELAVSSFRFLEKIYSNSTENLDDLIPSLLNDIRNGSAYLMPREDVHKVDMFFMKMIAKGFPYRIVLKIRCLFQKAYWFFDMKGVRKNK